MISPTTYSQDLRGRFIWSVPNSKKETAAGIVYFRKAFEVKGYKSALLEITCDDGFRLYVNGKLVGSNTNWQEVTRFDVSPLVTNGKNVIAVHAENASKSPAGLYCKLTVNTETEVQTITSNKSWKFSTNAQSNWRQAGYDDENWTGAFEQGVFGNTQPWGREFKFVAKGSVSVAKKKNKLPRENFELVSGDRIVFLGGTFAERLQTHGYLETLITTQFKNLDLKFRNLGWSGDNVFGLSRAVFGSQEDGFRRLENDLLLADPTLVIVCYGLNESFAGAEGLPRFSSGLRQLTEVLREAQADVIFVSPMLMENLGPPLPDPQKQNENIKMYTARIRKFAASANCGFLDNLKPLGTDTFSKTDVPAIRDQLTENGMHLSQYGQWRIAPYLVQKLGSEVSRCQFDLDLKQQSFTVNGSTIHSIEFHDAGVSFTAKDDKLVNCPPPQITPSGGKMMAVHDEIKISGLPPGKYGLKINGRPTILASDKQWDTGVLINRGNYLEQVEQLRQLIKRKNEMFFHRYRPQNETYLYLFRKHEQGNNAVEIPQFDPIIRELEKQITEMKQPEPVKYQLHRIDSSKPSNR